MSSESTLKIPPIGGDAERVAIWIGDDKFIVTGATVPTNGVSGYAPGCLFTKSSGAAVDATLYVNEGTLASADFNPVTTQ